MGPLELIYYLGYSLRKNRDMKNRRRLPRKVISVGNLTLGGTGKTPAVIALAEEARKRGLQPCVLTRGYKGKAQGPCFVSKGNGPLLSAEEAGDEAFLMAERFKGVPIVKGRDRYEAGMFALQHLQFELLFIMDDGFQHWKLWRDRDILLINGTDPFGNKKLFPSGILREPLSEMKRADIIVITKISREIAGDICSNSLMSEIKQYNPDAPVYIGEHIPVCLRTLSGEELTLGTISGKKVFSFCGIAGPSSFKESLLRTGADVKGFMAYRDHHRYSPGDVIRICEAAVRSGADWIVTTEKDIIKLTDFGLPENLLALRIEFRTEEGFYETVFVEE
ncbi:MAG TPA: tetraacyldisaccharide 4'-kinase [Thermodesulfovibrionales bacterium]|nr:tetraacyldisaccharide 4'-kinase [Thermodesulfovibrionales bacterium]